MAGLSGTFGIAARNFTAYPEMPDANALVEYGVKMEQLGFDSLWVWDHVLLGVQPNFPIIESLTLLTAIAARTKRIKLGTGILVLPLRNPVVLEHWRAWICCRTAPADGDGVGLVREFDAVGVPFEAQQDHGRDLDI
jgi:alkanesulfonate monooxygenase